MKYSKLTILSLCTFLLIACNPANEIENPKPEGLIPEAQLLDAAEIDLVDNEPHTIAIIKKMDTNCISMQ